MPWRTTCSGRMAGITRWPSIIPPEDDFSNPMIDLGTVDFPARIVNQPGIAKGWTRGRDPTASGFADRALANVLAWDDRDGSGSLQHRVLNLLKALKALFFARGLEDVALRNAGFVHPLFK